MQQVMMQPAATMLVSVLVSVLPQPAAAVSVFEQPSCIYTLDTAENKAGMIRGGSYYTATVASADVAACAELCCAAGDRCRSFSLDVGWGMQWLDCVAGKPCCALNREFGPFEPYNGPMNVTTGVVHVPPSTGKPPGVNQSFDCAVRELAYAYAQSLRPDKGDFTTVHDALQLSRCNVTLADGRFGGGHGGSDSASAMPPHGGGPAATGEPEFFVSANNGSDSANGSIEAPFQNIQRGVAACRGVSAGTGTPPCTVTLRGAVYFLGDNPVQLTAADSGLTLRSYAGEWAELSGGEPLPALSWTRSNLTGRASNATTGLLPR